MCAPPLVVAIARAVPPLEVVDANPCRQHRHRRTRPEILTFFRPPEREYDQCYVGFAVVHRYLFGLDVDGDDSIDLVRDVDLHREGKVKCMFR